MSRVMRLYCACGGKWVLTVEVGNKQAEKLGDELMVEWVRLHSGPECRITNARVCSSSRRAAEVEAVEEEKRGVR